MLVRQRYDLDRTVRLVINCVLFVGAIWLISILKGVLLPFCVGCLIAYLFEPFVQFNRQLLNLKGRVIASLVTLFEMTFFLLVILYFIAPMIISESSQMAALLKSYTQMKSKSHSSRKVSTNFYETTWISNSSRVSFLMKNG